MSIVVFFVPKLVLTTSKTLFSFSPTTFWMSHYRSTAHLRAVSYLPVRHALGVNKENLLRVVGKTNFRILKRNSDVVFDAEHEFHIRFSFWRTEISKIAFYENRNLANLKNSIVFHGLRTWTKIQKFQKNVSHKIFFHKKLSWLEFWQKTSK